MTLTKKRSIEDLDGLKSKKFRTEDNDSGNKKFNKPVGFNPRFQKDKKFDRAGGGKFGNKFSRDNKFAGGQKFGKDNKFSKDNKFGGKSNNFKADNTSGGDSEVPEKTDWKELKKQKKELKLKRKQTKSKDLYELTVQAKQIYERLKCKTTPKREELAKELHKLLKGSDNYAKLVLAHDTARVVQCMLKQSHADIKNEITQELIPNIVQMATSKYARFCVARMLKYGSNGMRERIINAMFGNVVKLATHNLSSNLVCTAYLTWATNKQKYFMKQEFYGDLYKKTKDEGVKIIADTWKNAENMKPAILSSVKSHLEHAVNKNSVDNSLIHTLLVEYLPECNEEDRNETVVSFSPLIASICTTKDGARAASLIFWYSGNKERRVIMKTIKENIITLCTHEHGHTFILTVLTTLDDTVNMKKILLEPILKKIENIISSKWGRRIIEWVVCPGDKTYFHPALIASIEEGLKHCKKDVEVKRKEILEAMEKPLCRSIAENGVLWLQGGHTGLATVAILKISNGEHSRDAYNSLAAVICDPEWMVQPTEENETMDEEQSPVTAVEEGTETGIKGLRKIKNPLEVKESKLPVDPVIGIEHAGLHKALKKLAKTDEEKIKIGAPTFGEAILKNITEDTLKKWIPLNRACFLLINIFENGIDETKAALKEAIRPVKKLLVQQKHAGSKILQQKMNL